MQVMRPVLTQDFILFDFSQILELFDKFTDLGAYFLFGLQVADMQILDQLKPYMTVVAEQFGPIVPLLNYLCRTRPENDSVELTIKFASVECLLEVVFVRPEEMDFHVSVSENSQQIDVFNDGQIFRLLLLFVRNSLIVLLLLLLFVAFQLMIAHAVGDTIIVIIFWFGFIFVHLFLHFVFFRFGGRVHFLDFIGFVPQIRFRLWLCNMSVSL